MSLEVSIRKRFPKFSLDAAFSCESGETLALLGASGSGKTLTLSCIAGVARPDGGRIVLDGRVLYDSEAGICLPPQKRMVGLLFQSYALFPNMTAEDNILCGLCRVKGRAAKRERLAELIKTLRLSGMERLYPRELSGGQQQRVALARLLASEPRLLMLDEPFSALDEALKWELEQELLEILSRLSVPVIYVTHDMREVRRLCGRVCVLDNGSAQEPQTPSELFQYPRTMAAARLSGCENVLEAERIDAHTVYVKDINARLKCTRDISGDMRGVAVRAEAIHIGAGEETLKCELLRVADDGGRLIAVLRAEGARATLKAEIKRDALAMYTVGDIIELSVPPKAVNPLDA